MSKNSEAWEGEGDRTLSRSGAPFAALDESFSNERPAVQGIFVPAARSVFILFFDSDILQEILMRDA